MVTSYARIKLFSIISEIEKGFKGRVLYFDTDSVIFIDEPGKGLYVPEIGDFLGDMTDEIAKDYGPEAFINRFSSGGPKNYAYEVLTPDGPKLVTKVKGLNITDGIKDTIDFNCVREIADKYRAGDKTAQITVAQLQFRSTSRHSVFTNLFDKKYRAVVDKRIVLSDDGDYQTLPFGYIRINNSDDVINNDVNNV